MWGPPDFHHCYNSVTANGIPEAFSKVPPPETKVGKFLNPIFQYGSNGSECAGKRGWFRCLSGLCSHSVRCGCLTMLYSVYPQRYSDGCAIHLKDHPERAVAF